MKTTSGEVTPAWSPVPSPIPTSPSPAESECKKGAPTGHFAGLGDEVLETEHVSTSRNHSRTFLKPLPKGDDYLPGQPRIRLSSRRQDADKDPLLEYLREYHLTKELDGLLPFMKIFFVSRALVGPNCCLRFRCKVIG